MRPGTALDRLATVLLLTACASAPRQHLGPTTGSATFAGCTYSCSQAGLFASNGAGERWLGDPGVRPFALAAGVAGLLVGGGEPAQSGELVLCNFAGQVQARVRLADEVVYAVAQAPNGKLAAAAGGDGQVSLVALPGLTGAHVRWSHAGPAVAVAFAPDGDWLVSGGHDGVLLLGPVAGDTAPQTLVDHTAAVTCVAWHPDGIRLVSGAVDGKLRLHDRSGRLLRTWSRLGGAVASVEFVDGKVDFTVLSAPDQLPQRGLLDLP